MSKKPKPEKTDRSKLEEEYPQLRTTPPPKLVRSRKMTQEELHRLSRDYVLAHEKLTILSRDYVIEHGKKFGEGLWWDRSDGYYICDFSEDEEEGVYYTRLGYDLYKNGSLKFYRYYEDGLEHGDEAEFYPSGVLKSYTVNRKKHWYSLAYEWNENGMIRYHFDGQQDLCVDEEGYMLIPEKV